MRERIKLTESLRRAIRRQLQNNRIKIIQRYFSLHTQFLLSWNSARLVASRRVLGGETSCLVNCRQPGFAYIVHGRPAVHAVATLTSPSHRHRRSRGDALNRQMPDINKNTREKLEIPRYLFTVHHTVLSDFSRLYCQVDLWSPRRLF